MRNERRPRNEFNQYSISGVPAGLTTRITSPPCRTRPKESRGGTSPTCRTQAKQCRRKGEGEKAHPRTRRIAESATQGEKAHPRTRRKAETPVGGRPNQDRLCDRGTNRRCPYERTNGREFDFRGSRNPKKRQTSAAWEAARQQPSGQECSPE